MQILPKDPLCKSAMELQTNSFFYYVTTYYSCYYY